MKPIELSAHSSSDPHCKSSGPVGSNEAGATEGKGDGRSKGSLKTDSTEHCHVLSESS